MFVKWRQESLPHSIRVELQHTELPKASHLHLTVKPARKTLLCPVLPIVYPRAGAKAQLPFPELPAAYRGSLPPQIAGTQISCSRLQVFGRGVIQKLERPEPKL